ncbi:uncharacterized protein LOC123875757 [Maniola jurtina]|uniref:uncharacterized protein LOC123875757 n=1 Tax=Maniola jurtina TaxID=191418 RepID=UPI001E68CF68|nr:uncharacterized protein LOC123875757 [Maniola jurtina]
MADSNHVVFPRKLLRKFILLYKELSCLWDRKCLMYKQRKKRHEAITKLTELVQEYEPTATRVHVLRKIESLRACMRREHKKVQDSRMQASHVNEVYSPHLWYYDLLSFVVGEDGSEAICDENDKQQSPEPEQEDDADEPSTEPEQEDSYDEMQNYQHYAIGQTMVEVSGSPIQKPYNFEEDKSKRHCTEVDDEYDAIGINVAAKLRGLPPNMRILAEKLINDVLFQAQMNGLQSSTVITTPDPFKQDVL